TVFRPVTAVRLLFGIIGIVIAIGFHRCLPPWADTFPSITVSHFSHHITFLRGRQRMILDLAVNFL
ncbi:MAG: hypothetical protein ACI4PH_11440, partial [Faecousia sp.]